MPYFAYRALNHKGRIQKGVSDAPNECQLEENLLQQGLQLVTAEVTSTESHTFLLRQFFSPKHRDLFLFCFQMEQLIGVGLPLLDSLHEVQETIMHPFFKNSLKKIITDVNGGKMLSEAFANHPRIFDETFIALIRVGESTGDLPQIFVRLAEIYRWYDEVFAQTKKLLLYPLITLISVLGTIAFLMIYLVPKMLPFLKSLSLQLPLHTRILIAVSNFLMNYWYVLVILSLIGWMGMKLLIKNNLHIRLLFDKVKLNIPLLGAVMQKIILARFARIFALLYRSGVPVLDALRICEGGMKNSVVTNAIKHIIFSINSGESLSQSFQAVALFPPLVIRMIKTGETSGAVGHSLEKISDFYSQDVKIAIENFTKVIEPFMTLVLGAILAFVIFAILGPIYGSITKMKL